jgi:hypothetical protein
MPTCHNDRVSERRYFDSSQPQTLQGAVMLSYINVGIAVLFMLAYGPYLALVPIAGGFGAYGIANERRWGYRLGVTAAVVYVLQSGAAVVWAGFGMIITLFFAIVLLALLLHPQSREYQKIWFH